MARLSLKERLRIGALAADRSRRSALSRVLYSPLLRWRYGALIAEQLLIVPQDLRTADPSFWREIELDQFGLAGSIAVLLGHSPFDIEPPNLAWARALHGFSWLNHLDAADSEEARSIARRLATEWTIRHRGGGGVPWETAVAARRLISWISHANLLLDGASQRTYDAITESLGMQLVHISAAWRDAPQGYPRLLALTALVFADLSIAGHDRQLAGAVRAFAAELTRQILPDGGHISRNPAVLVDLLLDLLPLRQCFASRGRTPPEALGAAIKRMLAMLRFMRMGDGQLARFNGMGVPSPASLATVLAYDEALKPAQQHARHSRYARLERGDTIVMVDTGSSPPLEVASGAHAGCLSFELSAGQHLLFVNGGAPGTAHGDWHPVSRATASHNTLAVAEKSSARLIRHETLEQLIGGAPIRGPGLVRAAVEETDAEITLSADHDGYVRRFGLVHARRLTLSADGRRLSGTDRLEAARSAGRKAREVPYAIHFHAHPEVALRPSEDGSIEVIPASGEPWRFTAEGATATIDESIFFADSAGPSGSLQIVLNGTVAGASEVQWILEQRSAHPV